MINFYAKRLQSNPLATSMTTSLLIMTCGDIMAQKIEKSQIEAKIFATTNDAKEESIRENIDIQRRVSLQRYMTKYPNSSSTTHRSKSLGSTSDNENEDPISEQKISHDLDSQLKKIAHGVDVVKQTVLTSLTSMQKEIEEIDVVRSTSMGIWACCAITPGHIILYKTLDRFLPTKQTPLTMACRLAAMVAYSIPNNAAFFTYGTCVHHAVEWYDKTLIQFDEYTQTEADANTKGDTNAGFVPPAFHAAQMFSNTRMKIEAELWPTLVNSQKLWLPVHFVNFTVVPIQLRPLTISVISLFWNCYLSLVQHRDIHVPEE